MIQSFPMISVVVNNYNYADYLEEALESALTQLAQGDEIIVVDDGSTDSSRKVLERYKSNPSICVIEQENQGQMNAVRNGIARATGDVLALLDSDDAFLEGYLSRLRDLYRQFPEVSYIFSEPEVDGTDPDSVRKTRDIIDHMQFLPGPVGETKWAAIAFGEYVGASTSGTSLKKTLAQQIMTLPETVDLTIQLPALKRRLLGLSEHEGNKFGFAADAIIVRCASALGVSKFYNEQPGFMYRIHGANKYASVPRWGRWYMRSSRKRHISKLFSQHFGIPIRPSSEELWREFLQRSLPLRLRRRLRLRFNYSLAVLTSPGSIRCKSMALLDTTGLRQRPKPRQKTYSAFLILIVPGH
ncbi:MAG: glycosyltransferase family 2 protein, partial [Pseudomonadota bacterium]